MTATKKRGAKTYTRAGLAELLGVTLARVSQYVNGKPAAGVAPLLVEGLDYVREEYMNGPHRTQRILFTEAAVKKIEQARNGGAGKRQGRKGDE
jgi:predicted transcriptional regulator